MSGWFPLVSLDKYLRVNSEHVRVRLAPACLARGCRKLVRPHSANAKVAKMYVWVVLACPLSYIPGGHQPQNPNATIPNTFACAFGSGLSCSRLSGGREATKHQRKSCKSVCLGGSCFSFLDECPGANGRRTPTQGFRTHLRAFGSGLSCSRRLEVCEATGLQCKSCNMYVWMGPARLFR